MTARGHGFRTVILACLFALDVLVAHGSAGASPPQVGVSPASIRPAIATALSSLRERLPAIEGRDLANLYSARAGDAAWLLPDGRPGPSVAIAIRLLSGADTEGLDPADYDVNDITTRLAAFPTQSVSIAADFDVRLSTAVLRYYRHVHTGRVDPRRLGLSLAWPADTHDMSTFLQEALLDGRIVEQARALAPPFTQYALLQDALARYRQLAASDPARPTFAATLRPGDTSTDLAALHRLLVTLGDLPADTPVPAGVYDDTLVAGVRRFQERHGLDVDGIIGKATQSALAVPLRWRVRQFELALERLRWLPDLSGDRVIAVNIPTFRLFAWSRLPSAGAPELSMRVVVGRAMRTETPIFFDRMNHVVFRPYWNVPSSILRGEIIAAIRRDPSYLTKQNMEIVQGDGDNSPVLPATAENIARLGQAGIRVRQRPGAGNSLGLLKFMFPNNHNVYMHDTPATQLFSRSRRDFSHGCIRVEDPARLAEWVLADRPGWGRDAVLAAMQGAPNRRVDLPRSIQVVIFYTTVIVLPEDGSVYFAEDIYGHDTSLDKVL